jgi:ABC-type antimicrobial peptide transport system ATPase subunit
MDEKNSQIYLYQQRAEIRQKNRPLKLEKFHFNYLRSFARRHRRQIIFFLILLFSQIILEVTLLVFGKNYLRQTSALLQWSQTTFALFFLTTGVVAYIIIAFWELKIGKSLVIYLINELRHKWIKIFLNKPFPQVTSESKASLIAKISYHLPLLQMGLDNSVVGLMQWALYVLGLILVSLFLNTTLLIIVLLAIPINIGLALIGYYIAKHYVSKETTLYSKIIAHITSSLYELPFLQKHKLENEDIKKLDELVQLDTYFRIRRRIWILFGHRIIFGILILIVGFSYVLRIYAPNFFTDMQIDDLFISGVIFIYLARLLYTSLKIGLFVLPAKLGLILSLPRPQKNQTRQSLIKNIFPLTFQSPKAKLFRLGSYLKKISFSFQKGERVLISGKNSCGKTHLGYLFSGLGLFSRQAWIVKVGRKRYFYNQWQKKFRDAYFIEPQINSEKNIGEILIGKNREKITKNEIENAFQIIEKYPPLHFILSFQRFIAENCQTITSSPLHLFALEVAHCLITQPKIVIIDNLWLDLNYKKIKEILKILDQGLPYSAIVFLSTKDNQLISYTQKYVIKENKIEKI